MADAPGQTSEYNPFGMAFNRADKARAIINESFPMSFVLETYYKYPTFFEQFVEQMYAFYSEIKPLIEGKRMSDFDTRFISFRARAVREDIAIQKDMRYGRQISIPREFIYELSSFRDDLNKMAQIVGFGVSAREHKSVLERLRSNSEG